MLTVQPCVSEKKNLVFQEYVLFHVKKATCHVTNLLPLSQEAAGERNGDDLECGI
jgi:hypothetical protein